jgi:hypothetical protein
MATKVPRIQIQWRGVQTGDMCRAAGVSSDTLKHWRVSGSLQRGLYWWTLPNSDRILWNLDLVRDWMVNGNSPAHQRAIERYLKSLPSSDDYQPQAA